MDDKVKRQSKRTGEYTLSRSAVWLFCLSCSCTPRYLALGGEGIVKTELCICVSLLQRGFHNELAEAQKDGDKKKPQISHPLTSAEHTHMLRCTRMLGSRRSPAYSGLRLKVGVGFPQECPRGLMRVRLLKHDTGCVEVSDCCSGFSRQALC